MRLHRADSNRPGDVRSFRSREIQSTRFPVRRGSGRATATGRGDSRIAPTGCRRQTLRHRRNQALAAPLAIALSSFLLSAAALAEPAAKSLPRHPSEIAYPTLEFHPPKPERVEMENGLVAFLLPERSIPLIRATALIRAGALCESTEEQGLSDLAARVMRLGGTVQVSATAMNERLEYVGASLESGSDRDYSSVSLRVLSKDGDLGFRLMSDLLQNPAFPQDKIDQRKSEALEALRRENDDPMEITRREFRKLLYGDHPYGRDPLGTPETLAAFDRDDLVAWHSRWYHPDRTIFAVAGDFDRDWMLERLGGLFGTGSEATPASEYPEVLSQPTEGKKFFIVKDLNQSTVRVGHLGIRKDNPDALALDVLNYIIGGGGFTSRLVNKVRTESGYAYLVASVFDEPLLTGQFLAVLQTQTKNAVKAARLATDIIRDAVENANVTEEELKQAKDSKLNEFVFNFETPYDVVRRYAEMEYYGLPPDYLETYRERLANITLQDLARVGRQYVHPDRMTALVLGHNDLRAELGEWGPYEEIDLTESETLGGAGKGLP